MRTEKIKQNTKQSIHNNKKQKYSTSKKVLKKINTPEELKKLSVKELIPLCDDIREFLIENVTKTGGHLGSNLGVVEITTALHYVFDFLNDALIFDVSHQSYVHKILTGRKDGFIRLRKYKGLSGFTNKNESPYDRFTFGHAGTALSTGLGMAEAYKQTNKDNTVVVLVGDASISAGMSFEALNHLGSTEENLLIILNDNEMSIAPTVGSLGKHLTKSRANPLYIKAKEKTKKVVRSIPIIGKGLYRFSRFIKNSIKHIFFKESIFEELSIPYYGPMDGHDVPSLVDTINYLKQTKGPKLLHIYTEKGKGMPNLENEPTRFHSYTDTTSLKKADAADKISYTEAFSRTITDLAKRNGKIRAVTAAMPDGTGLIDFQKKHPNKFYDVGICEQHAVGLSAGLASEGLRPVCALYSSFLQRAYDQVFHEVCLQNVPVVFALDRGGLVGSDGPTHHGVFDIAFLRTLPNIVLCSPKDNYEFSQMLEYLTTIDKPSAIRYPKTKSSMDTPEKFEPLQCGKAEILIEKEDADITILAYGSMVETAQNILSKNASIKANLVNMRFVKPIDKEVIKHFADKRLPVITLEEHSKSGGFGSAVLECLNELGSDVFVKLIGIPDAFIEHGSRDELLHITGIDEDSILEEIHKIVSVI